MISLSHVQEVQKTEEVRVAWVKTACALIQTRKYPLQDRYLWMRLANSFMAADRVSLYVHPADSSRYLLHKSAAWRFESEVSDLRAELVRQRNGRRRFPHH